MAEPMRATINLDGVAAALGIGRSRLYRNLKTMRASGFPPHLPGLRGRYDPAAIAAWQDGLIAGKAMPESDAVEDELAAARQRMAARARGASA